MQFVVKKVGKKIVLIIALFEKFHIFIIPNFVSLDLEQHLSLPRCLCSIVECNSMFCHSNEQVSNCLIFVVAKYRMVGKA